MATIGVLAYTLPSGLKFKNNLNKMAINNNNNSINNNNNNNNNNNINNNNIITKIENVSMVGNEILVMRKKQKLVPLSDSKVNNIQQTPAIKRLRLSDSNHTNPIGTVIITGSGKKCSPQPQAVARRNARERNRVKQVNNGFAALRQRIPDEVAEAFEAAGNGRGTAKKLSKVETLRMAVEYIRSLERLLEIDTSNRSSNDDRLSPIDDTTVIKTESCSSSIDDHYSESNYDPDESTIFFTDNLPDVTTVNGQQYLRIPGTNTYQLITTELYENEENIQPIHVTNSYHDVSLEPQIGYTMAITDEIVPTVIAPASAITITTSSPPPEQQQTTIISSVNYSNTGQLPISPVSDTMLQQQQDQILSQLQMQHQILRIKSEDISNIYQNHLPPNSSPLSDGQNFIDAQLYDGVITLKRKIKEEDVILETAGLSEESMMEAIDWWDTHTPQSDESGIL